MDANTTELKRSRTRVCSCVYGVITVSLFYFFLQCASSSSCGKRGQDKSERNAHTHTNGLLLLVLLLPSFRFKVSLRFHGDG